MEENTLSVLKIAPGQHPQQVEIDNDLKALQEAVGGTISNVGLLIAFGSMLLFTPLQIRWLSSAMTMVSS